MKIIYVIDRGLSINKVLNEIDCYTFFQENKLVFLSRYPYIIDIHNVPLQKLPYINNSIMHIALGNLAYVLHDNEMQIQNYGPTFYEQDLVDFPINYFQKLEKKQVEAVTFNYTNYLNTHHFHMDRLNHYLEKKGIQNNDSLQFESINYAPEEECATIDHKPRKVLFISATGIFYGYNTNIRDIEEVVKEYLNNGNFLVLLTHTGPHNGYPFAIDTADILDTNPHVSEYRELLNFFQSLNILDDQVSNFKLSYTGINFRGGCYNFGFSWNNMEQFFAIYLDYLRKKGYLIENVYILDRSINGYVAQSMKNKINSYVIDVAPTQKDFNEFMKKKIL